MTFFGNSLYLLSAREVIVMVGLGIALVIVGAFMYLVIRGADDDRQNRDCESV
ncbi:MAG: hypothetical protein LiPW15_355 [Parcubacteria group bacterium LiPW_15]|nr:MAG: hypothetical protein LiPW15_355 [Parcubacteria group bacterium LiPW_15]